MTMELMYRELDITGLSLVVFGPGGATMFSDSVSAGILCRLPAERFT